MHDSDPFRVPSARAQARHFPSASTWFRDKVRAAAYGAEVERRKDGEQELGQGVMHLPLSGANPSTKDEAP